MRSILVAAGTIATCCLGLALATSGTAVTAGPHHGNPGSAPAASGHRASLPDHSGHPGHSGHSVAGAPAPRAKGAKIIITGLTFSRLTVKPGKKITVVNQTSMTHTVTKAKKFDVTIPPGGTATFKAPKKKGSYAYKCLLHFGMKGKLVVK